MSVYLIGEIASAHDNSWEKVERLVALCSQSGFSACKLQYWSSADRLADRRNATQEYRNIYRKYAIPLSWLDDFTNLCHSHSIESACTVYLKGDERAVANRVDVLKVASFENEDSDLIRRLLNEKKRVIVSCGMLPIERRDRRVQSPYLERLACVSAYPAAIDGALYELRVDARLATADHWYDGYSDHTRNPWTGAVAVACGAQIIEVHVRSYDTSPENPDYATALAPDEFLVYATGVRTAERLIADVPVDESEMLTFKVRP